MKKIISFLILIAIVGSTYVYAWDENLTWKQKQDVWFNSAVGRSIDSDWINGAQNVDVAYDYTNAIFGSWKNTIGSWDAWSLFNTGNPEYFTKIANDPKDPNQVPLHWDIIVWKNHIAVVESASSDGLTILQQKNTGTERVFLNWVASYKVNGGYPLGWLRPNLDKIWSASPQTPIMSPVQQTPNAVTAPQPISIDPKNIWDTWGGLNLKLWCKYKWFSDISSPASNKPYDWKCKDAKSKLYWIDINNACQVVYGSSYTSVLMDKKNAFSWKCKKNEQAKVITTPTPQYPWNITNCFMVGEIRKSGRLADFPDITKSTPDYFSDGWSDGNGGDGHNYGCRQCASYVAWRVYIETWKYPNWGDASNFPSKAIKDGYKTGSKPKIGSIGVSLKGKYWHVVWVSWVNIDGTINIEQYNRNESSDQSKWGMYSKQDNLPASTFNTYIYIK